MKRLIRNLFSALLLLALAAGLVGMAFGYWNTIFFPGWWTLFLIIPAIYGFINDGINFFNSILFLVGVSLLLPNYIETFKFKTAIFICIAFLLLVLALRIVFSPYIKRRRRNRCTININTDDKNTVSGSENPDDNHAAKFNSKTVDYTDKEFNGASLEVAFGAIKLDLRKAIITHDAEVSIDAKFGGIEIVLPDNVGVLDKCSTTFGGVDIKSNIRKVSSDYPKIILTGNCEFGGIDVKN